MTWECAVRTTEKQHVLVATWRQFSDCLIQFRCCLRASFCAPFISKTIIAIRFALFVCCLFGERKNQIKHWASLTRAQQKPDSSFLWLQVFLPLAFLACRQLELSSQLIGRLATNNAQSKKRNASQTRRMMSWVSLKASCAKRATCALKSLGANLTAQTSLTEKWNFRYILLGRVLALISSFSTRNCFATSARRLCCVVVLRCALLELSWFCNWTRDRKTLDSLFHFHFQFQLNFCFHFYLFCCFFVLFQFNCSSTKQSKAKQRRRNQSWRRIELRNPRTADAPLLMLAKPA